MIFGTRLAAPPAAGNRIVENRKYAPRLLAGRLLFNAAASESPVTVVPVLATPRIPAVTTLMVTRQLIIALGVLVSQILMHLTMLPTVQALFVGLVMLVLNVVVGIVVAPSHPLVPICMTAVVIVAVVFIAVVAVAVTARPDSD